MDISTKHHRIGIGFRLDYGPRVPIGGGVWSGKDFFKADCAGELHKRRLAKRSGEMRELPLLWHELAETIDHVTLFDLASQKWAVHIFDTPTGSAIFQLLQNCSLLLSVLVFKQPPVRSPQQLAQGVINTKQ